MCHPHQLRLNSSEGNGKPLNNVPSGLLMSLWNWQDVFVFFLSQHTTKHFFYGCRTIAMLQFTTAFCPEFVLLGSSHVVLIPATVSSLSATKHTHDSCTDQSMKVVGLDLIWFGFPHIAFQSVLLKQNLLHVFSALSAASSMTQHTMPEFSCCLSEWRSAQFFLCCIHHYNILLSRVECSKQTQTYGLYWVNNPLGSKFVLSGIH